jgi:hypothetical protein
MKSSYNQDIFLERRKTYFYWASQLEKMLPNFQAAKDAYIAATSDATHWMFDAGGQHNEVHKSSVSGGLQRSKFDTAIYKRMRVKRDQKSVYQGPKHEASGESRGRNQKTFNIISSKDSMTMNKQHDKHRSSVLANITLDHESSMLEPIRPDLDV